MPTKIKAASLALPDKFRETALAFPNAIKASLATIGDATGVADMLDRAEVMAQYARRLRADTDVINALAYGKLLIGAKLGELMPGEQGKGGGRGKKKLPKPGLGSFAVSAPTLALYRKLAEHQPRSPRTPVARRGPYGRPEGLGRLCTPQTQEARRTHPTASAPRQPASVRRWR